MTTHETNSVVFIFVGSQEMHSFVFGLVGLPLLYFEI